jgi:hypothetical protein
VKITNPQNFFFPFCSKERKINAPIQSALSGKGGAEQFQTFFANVIRGEKSAVIPLSIFANGSCPHFLFRFC